MIATGAAGLCIAAPRLSTATPMPNPAGPHWDDGQTFWDDGSLWSDNPSSAEPTLFLPTTPIHLNTHTTMQTWEITKERAILSLTVWTQHAPTLKIGILGTTDLSAFIDEFEPLVQGRAVKQDDVDAAYRAQQTTLAKLRALNTKVPAIMEGQLNDNELLMKDLKEVYQITQRSASSILDRARALYPVWLRANTALAALTPTQPPITRTVQGVVHTVVMFKALMDDYTMQAKTTSDKKGLLAATKKDLAEVDEKTDKLNKDWYKVMKATYDPGSAAYEALSTIPTEGGTPAPDTIEIDTVVQGGEDGLHVEVEYEPGGGAHATTKLIKWMVVGVDVDFTHSAPLTAEGNAIGPFTVGQVVNLMTEATNSSGTRNSAPRTITIEPPIT
jgi:hypothetical protein